MNGQLMKGFVNESRREIIREEIVRGDMPSAQVYGQKEDSQVNIFYEDYLTIPQRFF